MADVINILRQVQFLVNSQGQKVAIQMQISDWEALLEWIENQEDEKIVKSALNSLESVGGSPQKAAWLAWDAVKDEWEKNN
ncbi:hypothetical protein [Planktothrix mougeotii]|uniref:Uncharacterized protein n=1 Tax=Planktothrix mougeotii LEGE 06226 TaxID=1828728 RepID=A0ABR9UJY4_9CYAN|nr:hypothetical protein [Planktothrix mougeotii]MBE9146758.1 hypothetical protein [Planktothrix mougeotii LEGE 06226]